MALIYTAVSSCKRVNLQVCLYLDEPSGARSQVGVGHGRRHSLALALRAGTASLGFWEG